MTRLFFITDGDDCFFLNELQVDEVELADSLERWREDEGAMHPEVVFASMVADLA